MSNLRPNRILVLASTLLIGTLLAAPTTAATFADLSAGPSPPSYGSDYGQGESAGYPPTFNPGPYATVPSCTGCSPMAAPYAGGAEGAIPEPLDQGGPAVMAPPMPQQHVYVGQPGVGLPNQTLRLWTFGQTNSTTDPFNPWGLSTPYMFVPWSTPLSGWTNAQTWNWWRERSGAQPRNW